MTQKLFQLIKRYPGCPPLLTFYLVLRDDDELHLTLVSEGIFLDTTKSGGGDYKSYVPAHQYLFDVELLQGKYKEFWEEVGIDELKENHLGHWLENRIELYNQKRDEYEWVESLVPKQL